MTFSEKLNSLVGSTIQVATEVDITTGVLSSVTNDLLTLRTSGSPGYTSGEDVVYPIDRIVYVRVG